MQSLARWNVAAALAVAAVLAMVGGAVAADPPAAPKVSTFAPAKDLEGQVEAYLESLAKGVESADEYKDAEGKVAKEANALTVIALALGLHDEDNKYKAAAPALIEASQKLVAAKDYAAAKAGVEAVKKAAETKGDPAKLKWEKVASLDLLMKQVPLVNNRLKRNVKTEKSFKSKADSNAGDAAVLAVIAQASIADTSEAKGAEQVKQWYKFCEDMRDISAKLNADVRAGKFDAVKTGMTTLTKSCDDCHEVFHKEAAGKAE